MLDNPEMAFKPVVLKSPHGYIYFDYDEIVMFKAEGHFSLLYTVYSTPPPQRICHSLSYIEKNYSGNVLYRCHRDIIINLRHIVKIETKTRGIFLINNLIVKASERKFRTLNQTFREMLNRKGLSEKPSGKFKESELTFKNSSGKRNTVIKTRKVLLRNILKLLKKS